MGDGTDNINDSPKVSGKSNEEVDQNPTSAKSVPMTSEDVMERLGISEEKLKLLVSQSGLPVYYKHLEDQKPVAIAQLEATGLFQLPFLYFMSADIEKFERDHPDYYTKDQRKVEPKNTSLRNSQRHKERCRALAQYIWEQKKDRDCTIADMIKGDAITRIGCEGQKYESDTIREWIKNLCPNPKPGRPKKD
ncbi:MAG: hypothetical protein ACLP5H_20205 [Desulfomonilaceae bacterium]